MSSNKPVRFTIKPDTRLMYLSLMECFSYWAPDKAREGCTISGDGKKITIVISDMYCMVCNMLLILRRKHPEMLKAGKRATAFLDEYKRISRF